MMIVVMAPRTIGSSVSAVASQPVLLPYSLPAQDRCNRASLSGLTTKRIP